jgi:hypothetical protein
MANNFIFEIYKDNRTVLSLQEIALIVNEPDFMRLKQRIHYYVNTGKLRNIRRGIYVKEKYSQEELACKIFKPAYISLEYVLQKSGIIFQYSNQINIVSYLCRLIQVDGYKLAYRKIKNDILYNTTGIAMDNNGINIATPERAFIDTLYLNKSFYFDSIHSLNKELVIDLLSLYQSKELNKRVHSLLKNA